MEAQLGRGMSPEDRYNLLKTNSEDIEEVRYKKDLTFEEEAALNVTFQNLVEEGFELQDEKKAVVSEFNAKIKNVRKLTKDTHKVLKEGGEIIKENCFKMISYEEGLVGYYNAEGFLVIPARPLNANERQLPAFKGGFKILKTGTDD